MTETTVQSPGIWKKLLRNPAALTGLVIIAIALLACVFGYAIAPDNTPDADRQTVEIQSRPPGYRQLFLRIPSNSSAKRDRVKEFFFGTPATHKYVPINSYLIRGEEIIVDKYVDEDTSVTVSYKTAELTHRHTEKTADLFINKKFFLGTDAFGRDIFSRIIIGTRVSMLVGLIAVIISLSIGILLGALAGFYRGKTDAVIMWLVNVTWSIPTLLLVFAITLTLGKGFWQIFIAIRRAGRSVR